MLLKNPTHSIDFNENEIAEFEIIIREMAEYDLELAALNCLRKCVTHAEVKDKNKKDLKHVVELAKEVRPKIINISLSLEPEVSQTPEDRIKGLSVSPGGSSEAKAEDFIEIAEFLAELAEDADGVGVGLAIELHHCSIADTSRNLIKILELANHPNLSANPDLGNLYWGYENPEEPWYEAVERLVGRVCIWHVKNVQRIHVPEVERSFFVHAALDEGDIDYRWVLARLIAGGFNGYISVEGAGPGDVLAFAARGKAYLDELLNDQKDGIGLEVQ